MSQVATALSPLSSELRTHEDSSVQSISDMIKECLRQVHPILTSQPLAGSDLSDGMLSSAKSSFSRSTAVRSDERNDQQPMKKRCHVAKVPFLGASSNPFSEVVNYPEQVLDLVSTRESDAELFPASLAWNTQNFPLLAPVSSVGEASI